MAKKPNWTDYVYTFFDPYSAIEDGRLVTADNLFDDGKSGLEFTDAAYDVYRNPGSPSLSGYKANLDAAMSSSAGGADKASVLNYLNNYYDENSFWHSLSDNEKSSFLDAYGTALNGNTVIDDIAALENLGAAPTVQMPLSSELYADIDAELNPAYRAAYNRLDDEAASMRQNYQDQLQDSSDYYSQQASKLLSNQYLSNAQTYDVMQSDMRKARQNALEAGASAGVRLAGNVNALLSAQNKQSQTALDTSNALAEMMLQQRNAAAGIRSDYRNYMSDVNQRRTDLETQQRGERENLYNQRYNNAMNDYNSQWERWENKYSAIPESNKFKSAHQAYTRNKSTQ